MEFKDAKTKTGIFSSLVTLLVVGLLIFAGPANAFSVGLGSFDNEVPIEGEVITTTATLDIKSNERIEVMAINLTLNDVTHCVFDVNGNDLTGGQACKGVEVSLTKTALDTGYGYGFEYGYGYGYAYGEEYGYGYDYNYGFSNTHLSYEIKINTSRDYNIVPGTEYEAKISTTLGGKDYSSEVSYFSVGAKVPSDNEIFDDIGFLLPDVNGSLEDIPNVTTISDWTINLTSGNETFEVLIPADTTISGADGNINVTAIQSTLANLSELSGISGMTGALQFGIPNFGLEFSKPITIKIFVGTDYNGQTLNVFRSTTGSSGWTSDGLSPSSCLVSSGICEFNATKASYFVAAEPSTTTTTSGSTGGSGYCTTEWSVSEWSTCTNGVQTRIVSYPANFCTPTAAKPAETQSCIIGQDSQDEADTENQDRNTLLTGFVIGEFLSKPTNVVGLLIVLALIILAFLFVAKKRKSSVKGKEKVRKSKK